MKKLVGLLAFAAALAGAILLTQYYTRRYASPPPPAAAPAPPATGTGSTTAPPPASVPTDARGNAPVSFKVHYVRLDPAAKKGSVALTLEHDPARPVPASVWVWAYFFSPDAPGRYCAAEPVELQRPTLSDQRRDSVTVQLTPLDCPAPRTPSSTYYARVNVSTESAFAARLTEQRISYDITQASPVVVERQK